MSNYDLSKILPHNPPMILIDDILNYDLTQKTLTAIVKITEDKLFLINQKRNFFTCRNRIYGTNNWLLCLF